MIIIICGFAAVAGVFTSAIIAVHKSKKHMEKLYEGKEDES